jgi:hypothetical protein
MGFHGRQWIQLESGEYPSTRQGKSPGAKLGFQVKKQRRQQGAPAMKPGR